MNSLKEVGSFFKKPKGAALLGGIAGLSLFTAGLFTGTLPAFVAVTMAKLILAALVSALAGAAIGYGIASGARAFFATKQEPVEGGNGSNNLQGLPQNNQ